MNSVNIVGYTVRNAEEYFNNSVIVQIAIPLQPNYTDYISVPCVFRESHKKFAINSLHARSSERAGTKVAISGRLIETTYGLGIEVVSKELSGELDTETIGEEE